VTERRGSHRHCPEGPREEKNRVPRSALERKQKDSGERRSGRLHRSEKEIAHELRKKKGDIGKSHTSYFASTAWGENTRGRRKNSIPSSKKGIVGFLPVSWDGSDVLLGRGKHPTKWKASFKG